MKLSITSLATLLLTTLATSRVAADVRPPPESVDFDGPGAAIWATLLTAAFIFAGLWLVPKMRARK
jgi:hypothetical protein